MHYFNIVYNKKTNQLIAFLLTEIKWRRPYNQASKQVDTRTDNKCAIIKCLCVCHMYTQIVRAPCLERFENAHAGCVLM